MTIRHLAVLLSLVIFAFVLDLVRRRRLRFKYALGWLLASGMAVILSLFPGMLFWAAAFLGFELPSNFIFFTLSCVFVLLSLFLTVFLCQQNERNDRMAQKIAILEFKIQELQDKKRL